jgi:predicted Zn-dependent protease
VVRTDDISIREGESEVAAWRYENLRHSDAPSGVMRCSAAGATDLARLETRDAGLIAAIQARCPDIRDRRHPGESSTRRIVVWSLAAAASLVLTLIFLVPLAAERLTSFIPTSMEKRLGDAVDTNVRMILGKQTCTTPEGGAALAALATLLTGESGVDAEIAVLPSKIANAIALPGGRVYLTGGLLSEAESPDEVAGVLAHELGHVQHRDGLRALLRSGGTSFIVGLLFGDISGGAAIVIASRMLIDSSYSREAENSADAFAIDLMLDLGRSPQPLGDLLERIDDGSDGVPAFLSSHPLTPERSRAFDARHLAPTGPALLDAEQWQALKKICGAALR